MTSRASSGACSPPQGVLGTRTGANVGEPCWIPYGILKEICFPPGVAPSDFVISVTSATSRGGGYKVLRVVWNGTAGPDFHDVRKVQRVHDVQKYRPRGGWCPWIFERAFDTRPKGVHSGDLGPTDEEGVPLDAELRALQAPSADNADVFSCSRLRRIECPVREVRSGWAHRPDPVREVRSGRVRCVK